MAGSTLSTREKAHTMKHDHQLTYIDLHPQSIKPRRDWLAAIACVAIFAAIGVMLAWRG